jgi:ATPase subunit of ABC transporter with duplicated ATPase domains
MAELLYLLRNFPLVDEPTNHLDLATKEMLVGTLRDFSGTMVFVSHDRTFLRGLASRVLVLDGAGGKPSVFHDSYAKWVDHTGLEAPGVHR